MYQNRCILWLITSYSKQKYVYINVISKRKMYALQLFWRYQKKEIDRSFFNVNSKTFSDFKTLLDLLWCNVDLRRETKCSIYVMLIKYVLLSKVLWWVYWCSNNNKKTFFRCIYSKDENKLFVNCIFKMSKWIKRKKKKNLNDIIHVQHYNVYQTIIWTLIGNQDLFQAVFRRLEERHVPIYWYVQTQKAAP